MGKLQGSELLCLYSLQQIQAIIFEFPAIFCKPLLQLNNSTNFGASVILVVQIWPSNEVDQNCSAKTRMELR